MGSHGGTLPGWFCPPPSSVAGRRFDLRSADAEVRFWTTSFYRSGESVALDFGAVHPGFGFSSGVLDPFMVYDVALVHLVRPLSSLAPVGLSQVAFRTQYDRLRDSDWNRADPTLFAVGYGYGAEKADARVHSKMMQTWDADYRPRWWNATPATDASDRVVLDAKRPNHGDSGGPLLIRTHAGESVVVGVLSSCVETGGAFWDLPRVSFMDVGKARIRDWVNRTMSAAQIFPYPALPRGPQPASGPAVWLTRWLVGC